MSSLQPRLYHARTSVEIQPVAGGILKTSSPVDGSIQPPDIQTQIKILESDAVAGRARDRLNRNRSAGSAITSRIAQSLSVHPAGQTRIIEIEADAENPQLAAEYVNAVAQEYVARHVDAGEQASGVLTARLHQAIDELRGRLETADTALQSYARESGIILAPDRSSVAEDRLRQVQDAWSRAEADRVQKQARAEAVSQTAATGLAAALDDPAIKSGQEKLADLRRQRAELSVVYTPDYAKVKRLDAQIDSVASAVQSQIASAAGRVRSDFQEARQRETMLAGSYQSQRAAVLEEGEKRVHYAVLKSEADSTRALYDTMLARVKETGIESAMRDVNVRVLDRAVPAGAPFQPRRAQASLMGLVAGMLLGFFLAHNIDGSDSTVRTPEDLAGRLDAVELGVVPDWNSPAQADVACRPVLASLRLSSSAADHRVLAVSSALAQEGKTSVTAELGAAFARIGKRVLIIDGDLCVQGLTLRLAIESARGFGDLLVSDRPLDVIAIAPAIVPTPVPGLHILPVGALPTYSPDLLHSSRLNEVVSYARKNFDIVLIDCPPVLKTPDARLIARAADAAVLVFRVGIATRQAAWSARQVFAKDGTPMAGIILNDHVPQRAAGRYGANLKSTPKRDQALARRASA